MGWQDTSVPFHTEKTRLNQMYHTPNMERMASEGMKFTQAYASSLCSPSRVSALTGMDAARHRVTNWTLRRNRSPDMDTPSDSIQPPEWNVNGIHTEPGIEHTVVATPLPQLLRKVGYRTIHAGKAHFGAEGTPGENPLNLGFDVNIAGHAAGGPGSYWGEKKYSATWRNAPKIWDVPGLEKYHGTDTYLTEAITVEAIQAVEEAVAMQKPFYLYLSHYGVHAPFEQDERFYKKYVEAGLNKHDAIFASMLESMDKSLGDVMDMLTRLNIEKNTLLVFMSDNGSAQNNARNLPLRGHKIHPYEGGIRIPMIVRFPGIAPAGSTCNEYLAIQDIFPTFLEVAELTDWKNQITQTVDGISFLPLLKGGQPDPERALLWHFPHSYHQTPFSVLRKGDWKLIHYHALEKLELYNIPQDISEKENRVTQEPEKTREMAQELTRLLKERNTPLAIHKKTGESFPTAEMVVP